MQATTLKQRACEYIRERLLSGAFKAGDQLSDVTLSKDIGISRTPVREAISQLVSEGLLEQIPRFGVFVRKPSRKEMLDLYELRELLESHAAARACELITPEQLMRLRTLCDDYLAVGREAREHGLEQANENMSKRMVLADLEFHTIIVKASGNDYLVRAVSDYRILTHIMTYRHVPSDTSFMDKILGTWREHRRICAAIKNGDVEKARAKMAEHVHLAREGLIRWYVEHPEATGDAQETGSYPASVHALITGTGM